MEKFLFLDAVLFGVFDNFSFRRLGLGVAQRIRVKTKSDRKSFRKHQRQIRRKSVLGRGRIAKPENEKSPFGL